MIVVEQHSIWRDGHCGLSAKPLNAKQLRSDRGNVISIAANRFWLQYRSMMLHPHFSADSSPNSYQSAARKSLQKNFGFNSARMPQKALLKVWSQFTRHCFLCGELWLPPSCWSTQVREWCVGRKRFYAAAFHNFSVSSSKTQMHRACFSESLTWMRVCWVLLRGFSPAGHVLWLLSCLINWKWQLDSCR